MDDDDDDFVRDFLLSSFPPSNCMNDVSHIQKDIEQEQSSFCSIYFQSRFLIVLTKKQNRERVKRKKKTN